MTVPSTRRKLSRGSCFHRFLRGFYESVECRCGIPLFTSRRRLRRRVEEFLEAGLFLKKIGFGAFRKWQDVDPATRQRLTRNVFLGWQRFRNRKEALVAEVSRQIRSLG